MNEPLFGDMEEIKRLPLEEARRLIARADRQARQDGHSPGIDPYEFKKQVNANIRKLAREPD